MKKIAYRAKLVLLGLLVVLLGFGLFGCADKGNSGNDSTPPPTTTEPESTEQPAEEAPPIPESDETATYSVRYDGVYYCDSEDTLYEDAVYYIRFYDDGKVIAATSVDPISKLGIWFTRESDLPSIGDFTCTDNTIEFSVTGSHGTLDYNGQVLEDKLLLNTYSHINGNSRTDLEFLFSPW